MVLGHLGFTVSKVALKNDYLPIGEADFYRWNIGDPSHYSSYGCYSPVIAETARQYLRAQNSAHEVKDLTHFCIDEIYFQDVYKRQVITPYRGCASHRFNRWSWLVDGEAPVFSLSHFHLYRHGIEYPSKPASRLVRLVDYSVLIPPAWR